jgi:hypothetical protein
MNMPAESVAGQLNQDQFKIEMLLKEAELFQHDVHLISLAQGPGSLTDILANWTSNEDNLHTGRLNAFAKSHLDKSVLDDHPKLAIKRISNNLKMRDIREILLIGREVVVILTDEIGIFRDKRHVDMVNRIIKAAIRISVIEQQKESV